MQVIRVPYASPAYDHVVQLRREVLRLPLGLDFSAEDLQEERDEVILAILEEGRAIASLQLVLKGGVAKMRQVAVSPDFQGKGVGRVLVDASEAWCRENSVIRIVLNSRKSAEPFYLALGYSPVGEEFEEVGIPHIAMSKDL